MASVLVPVFYVIIVFGGLFIFSYYYRKRNAGMSSGVMSALHHLTHPLQPPSLYFDFELFQANKHVISQCDVQEDDMFIERQ